MHVACQMPHQLWDPKLIVFSKLNSLPIVDIIMPLWLGISLRATFAWFCFVTCPVEDSSDFLAASLWPLDLLLLMTNRLLIFFFFFFSRGT